MNHTYYVHDDTGKEIIDIRYTLKSKDMGTGYEFPYRIYSGHNDVLGYNTKQIRDEMYIKLLNYRAEYLNTLEEITL